MGRCGQGHARGRGRSPPRRACSNTVRRDGLDMAAHWRAASFTLSLMVVSAAGGQRADPSARPIPDALRAHLRTEHFSPLTTVAALPAGLRQALSELFKAPTLDMADPGAPFQATDVMVTPRL